MDQSSSVRKLCRFVLATSYNKQIPQICRWLIDKDEDGDFRFQVTMLSDNNTQQDISDHFANDDLDLGFHDAPVNTSAPNITLILILSAIFVILFISALLTCTRRKKESQNDTDAETESVMNMRIVTTLARLSRIHVVSLHHHHPDFDLHDLGHPDPHLNQPPPDYDTLEEIKKKEEEELPSYCQAVSSCHM